MKEYKRLTQKDGIGRFVNDNCINCKSHRTDKDGCDVCYGDVGCCGVLYNRLAELEDKIENRTLLELPCKVGDIVYYINKYAPKLRIEEYEVLGFELTRDYTVLVSIGFEMFLYKNEIILTKAEAEKKLKELQGNKE